MSHLKTFLQCLALTALSVCLLAGANLLLVLSQTVEDVGGTALAARLLIGEIRSELPVISASVDAKADRAISVVKDYLTTADRQITGTRSDLNARLDTLSGKLDAPLDAATTVLGNAAGIREDLKPVLSEAAQTAAIAQLTIHDLRPQLLGLVAAGKVTLGQTALTMREVERAMPQAIASVQAVQGSIQRSSAAVELGIPRFIENTNGIAANVRQLTKPRWWDSLAKDAAAGALVYGNVK